MNTEQTRAIMHGIDASPEHWSFIDLPVGPQPIPAWALGLHIEWLDGYGNAPGFRLKTDRNLRDWDGKRFRKDGSRYMAASADGRADVYHHDGPVSVRTLSRWARPTMKWDAEASKRVVDVLGGPVEYEALATTQQDGFGGDHVSCLMAWPSEYRGQTIVLRGPWSYGAPAGYVDLPFVNMNAKWRAPWVGKRPRPAWHRSGGIGNHYVREDVFLRIFAYFCPHLRLARCTYSGATTIEPLKPEWDEPKHWVHMRQRKSRAA